MYDPALAHSLKYNVAQFSAFKETSFRKQLEAALTKNGAVVPWSEFKKTAAELNVEYNGRWLKTEYHHTVATANMAEKWQDFEADKDLYPNLKYVTVGDNRVRDQHKAWNGLILPINHPFWKTHTTPNDWGCRCDILQTDEDPSEVIPDLKIKSAFQNNAALSGKIFNEIPYANGLSSDEIKEAGSFAKRNFENEVFERSLLKEFKNGGKINTSNLINASASDYKDVLKCCEYFAKKGSVTEILPTVNINSPLYKEIYGDLIGTAFEGKCPDFAVDGLFYELEGFDGVGNYSNMLKRGLKQSSKVILKSTIETDKHLKKLIKFSLNEGKKIEEVWILKDGELSLFYPVKTQ
jgi:SPP1 gp7 family putative phage head morphogenesis protein